MKCYTPGKLIWQSQTHIFRTVYLYLHEWQTFMQLDVPGPSSVWEWKTGCHKPLEDLCSILCFFYFIANHVSFRGVTMTYFCKSVTRPMKRANHWIQSTLLVPGVFFRALECLVPPFHHGWSGVQVVNFRRSAWFPRSANTEFSGCLKQCNHTNRIRSNKK